jgi:hypothetical protein
MISGAHAIVYSRDAEADRAFLRDVIGLPSVDVGGGWLIFGMPPSEVAVHPDDEGGTHELYFMCDDVEAFVRAMSARSLACSPVQNQGWGMLTQVTLPGGGKLGVYQPRHARPPAMTARAGKGGRKAAGGKTAGRKRAARKAGGRKTAARSAAKKKATKRSK